MANAVVRQNKLRRLVFAPEDALGTFQTLTPTSLVVPASDVSFTPSRGSRVISREALVDGFHGEAPGAIGSWAWEVSFTSEIHHYASYTPEDYDVYWTQLLQGCGFKAEDNGSDTITLYPTMAPIGNWDPGAATDGFTNPAALSFGLLNNNTDANDEPAGDSDSAHFTRGCVGNVSFQFTAGQIATMQFSFKGLVQNDTLIDTSVTNVMQTGSFTQIGGAPYVVRDAVLVFTDNSTTNAVTVTALNNVSIDMGANVPDVECANVAGNYGFDVSPVFWDSSPTVSFTIAETNASDDVIFQRLFSGDTFDIQLTLANPDVPAATIKIDINTLQQSDVSVGNTNGYATYSINGKCVRAVGDGTDDALMQITYTYA